MLNYMTTPEQARRNREDRMARLDARGGASKRTARSGGARDVDDAGGGGPEGTEAERVLEAGRKAGTVDPGTPSPPEPASGSPRGGPEPEDREAEAVLEAARKAGLA